MSPRSHPLALTDDTREMMYVMAELPPKDLRRVELLLLTAVRGELFEEDEDELKTLVGSVNIERMALAYKTLTGRRIR